MKNLINPKTFALISLLILFGVGCSSLPTTSSTQTNHQVQVSCPPTELVQTPASYSTEPEIDLTERTLEIDATDKSARLYYPFRVCVSKFIWCTEYKQVRIYYDLLQQDTKLMLKNKDFVCRVREKL